MMKRFDAVVMRDEVPVPGIGQCCYDVKCLFVCCKYS